MGVRAWPHRRVLVAVLALALVGSACSDDGSGSVPEGSGSVAVEAVLAETTRVVDDEAAEHLEVLPDRIRVPDGHELIDVAVGDVIAFGITDQTPDGLLRLVTDVTTDGGRVVASTRQAMLGEAFDQLDLDASVPVRFGRIAAADEGVALPSGLGARGEGPGAGVVAAAVGPVAQAGDDRATVEVEETEAGFIVSFDELLFDGDDDTSTTDDQVTLSGSAVIEVVLGIGFDVDVDLDLAPDGGLDSLVGLDMLALDPDLRSARVEVTGTIATNLQLHAEQAASFGNDTEVFAIEGAPIVIPVGGVPVVLRPRIPIVVGWDGRVSAAFDTSVTTSTEVRLGVEYREGEWSVIESVDQAYDFNPPELDAADPASASLRAGPRFEVRLWESFGSGSIGLDGVVRLELFGEDPWVCLSAGYRAPVGFRFVGEPVYDEVLRDDLTPVFPNDCEAGAVPARDVVPVAGYSRVFGTCTPLGTPVDEAGRRVAALGDGGVVAAAGVTRAALQGSQESRFEDLWLVRLDAAGNTLWTRTYDGLTGDLVALVPFGDGVVAALETGRMLFLDHRGELVDTRRLGGAAFLLRGLTALPDGSGFLALGVDGTVPVVAELGPDGAARWAQRYTGELADGGAQAASPRADGGWNVAIGGGDFLAVDAAGGLQHAARLLVDGELTPGGPRTAGSAGTLAAGAAGALVVVGADLDRAGGGGLGGGQALHGRDDGDFVAAGSSDGLALTRFDSTGATRWATGYVSGDASSTQFRGITSTTDGGIVAVGRTAALAVEDCGQQSEQWDLWVVKVPSTGLMTPDEDSGLGRATFAAELSGSTYEMIPIEARGDPFPLEVAGDDGVSTVWTYPSIGSHVSTLVDEAASRIIPAGQFEPHAPIRVTYEYTEGGPVSDRVTVAWDGDNLSVTHFEADVFARGAPQGSFRYLFGPDVAIDGGGCYLESPGGCGQLFVRASDTNSVFLPGPVGNVPRFEGTLPAIDVNRTEVWAGVDTACGFAVDELFGEIDLCVDEETGAVLYAHTITRCNDPDRTDQTCVELGAVEVDDPTQEDFSLPGQ